MPALYQAISRLFWPLIGRQTQMCISIATRWTGPRIRFRGITHHRQAGARGLPSNRRYR